MKIKTSNFQELTDLSLGYLYAKIPSDFFKLRCDDRNRGHQYKLFLLGYRSSVRQHFLSYRAVHTWNNLPADSTDFSNLRSFKRGLNSSFLARHSAVDYF